MGKLLFAGKEWIRLAFRPSLLQMTTRATMPLWLQIITMATWGQEDTKKLAWVC